MELTTFKFNIVEKIATGEFEINVFCTMDLKDEMEIFVRSLFEIEVMQGLVTYGEKQMLIEFKTINKEMVECLKKGLFRTFRKRSLLNNINYN